MNARSIGITLLSSVILAWAQAVPCAGEVLQEPVAIQVESSSSGGKYSLDEIARICRARGVKIVILAERDLMKWEYGLWPLRGLLKKTVEESSLAKYGARRYFEELARAQERNPDMLIIPGVESAPHYYWTGVPFSRDFTLNGWHRHMLAFGMRDPADYAGLPVTGNGQGAGYDQYTGELGPKPYQRYADYVDVRGGLSFWAHPDALNVSQAGGVRVETGEYADLLSRVDTYTGFLVFYEGHRRTGVPGGIWDQTLADYCAGRRKRPVWAAAGLAVDAEGGLEERLDDLRTIVEPESFTREAVLDAIRTGRMYVVRGKNVRHFVLEDFSVSAAGKIRGMGAEVTVPGAEEPVVALKGGFRNGCEDVFRVRLIRDGETVMLREEKGSGFDICFTDAAARKDKGYYRVEIESRGATVITNPIFYSSHCERPKVAKQTPVTGDCFVAKDAPRND